MSIRNLILALLLAPVLLCGQPGWNTVIVNVSSPSSAQPAQAVFNVAVDAGIDVSLDDVVGALAGSGITAANLVGIGVQLNPPAGAQQTELEWLFELAVPFSKLKETSASLATLQKSVAQKNSGLALSFALSASGTLPETPACDLVSLVADARKQAEKKASAAGLTARGIVGLAGYAQQSAPVCSLTATFALGLMFSQAEPNAITITASRTIVAPPDQISFGITVRSALTAGPDDIAAALAAAGITGATFSGVNTSTYYDSNNQPQSTLYWTYSLTTPLSKVKDTLALLNTARQTIGSRDAGLALTYYAGQVQASPQSQTVCQDADLVADARSAAQKLAAAGGLSAGEILSISSSSGTVSRVSIPIGQPGDFSFIQGTLSSFLLGSVSSTGCSLSVRFQLL